MKILTLNKKQEKHLLILCKEFFPEYKYVCLDVHRNPVFNKTVTFESEQWLELPDDECITVPWYQLCLTELPERIVDKLGDSDHQDDLEEMFCWDSYIEPWYESLVQEVVIENHPVDFLWKFIKKCKKHKYFKK